MTPVAMTTHFDWTQIQVEIQDDNLFRQIPLCKLRPYLRSTGWEFATHSHFGDILELSPDQDRIACPETEGRSDYTTRISHIIRLLAKIENRSQIAVVESIMNTLG
jgi:hypothetical protein